MTAAWKGSRDTVGTRQEGLGAMRTTRRHPKGQFGGSTPPAAVPCGSAWIAIAAAFPLVLLAPYAVAAEDLRVVFPSLALKTNAEYIEKLHMTVKCGHIQDVRAIPVGWSISVVRMNAGLEELRAEADHGATRLPSLGGFNGGVHVVPTDRDCFAVSARISVSGEASREIDLPAARLRLIP